ncbi:MlaD family protein [Novipirellula artificiosorum]|uniref:Mce/MlaD domain-containing protein n=1 Tax=Novipirellula artificiosorum TaxID=2528016 RepID=A0A5C6DY01_9BACT|nr:MlaD family protein [Novipirellula artificiosorum]TWU41124.1 hypothetical protein Poly41_19620 [Novipirellula artificiosorum]
MNEPYRLRYTNQIVGAFLLILLLFLIVLSILLLRASDYFVEQDHYWIEIAQEDIDDLHKGADVMILGERAGKVENIRYVDDSDKVRVNLAIDPQKSSEIFSDSIVLLERKYGIGTPILDIRRAKSANGAMVPLLPGNQLANFRGEADRIDQMAHEVESVSESVRRIQQKLDPTLSGIEQAADRFRGSLDNSIDPTLSQTMKASDSFYQTNEAIRPEALETLQTVRKATENLESQVESLTTKIELLVENDMRDTLVDVRESTDDISAAASRVNQSSVTVTESISETLRTLRDAAEEIHQLATETREVVRIVRKEANELPGTTQRVNETVSDTQDLVGEVRSHWLLRRYNTQPTSTPQVSPSSLRGGAVR